MPSNIGYTIISVIIHFIDKFIFLSNIKNKIGLKREKINENIAVKIDRAIGLSLKYFFSLNKTIADMRYKHALIPKKLDDNRS
ncbi:MAG: hypothetical protein KR126chlam6_01457 [Candidatus Anoxychlamydiales bacterium]|nr:hypothetical protein [Candidatus Anoxychlamydiales bacterium]